MKAAKPQSMKILRFLCCVSGWLMVVHSLMKDLRISPNRLLHLWPS